MVTDPIADMLTRIRNGQLAGHPSVTMPSSKKKLRVLAVMVESGYVERVESIENESGKPQIKVYLRYSKYGAPAVRELKRISKPGRRMYVSKEKIPYYKGGLGTVVISTSQGVLTDREARKRGVGGELLFALF